MKTPEALADFVRGEFEKGGVRPVDVQVRTFPGEQIVIVEVATQFERAMQIGADLDAKIDGGFVTVRQVSSAESRGQSADPVRSVRDPRVTKLIELLDARSRTSEAQPSLRYVEDVEGRLQVATGQRHHLVFGRRGVGKTSLLLEAKRIVEEKGADSIWLNVQTVRNLGSLRAFLTLASRICDLPIVKFGARSRQPESVRKAEELQQKIKRELDRNDVSESRVAGFVPELQNLLKIFTAELQAPVFLFLDDVHYLPYGDVPKFLDLVHGASRDCPVWLKVAGIKHQMRWFVSNPPTGLQTGHDAIEVDLDITLQEPERAKQFLQSVLDAYIDECDAGPRRGFLSSDATDRLVLASGGVPRDFATLCAAALQSSRRRANAKATGVQDVNEAAGLAAKVKIQELEDDAAAALGSAQEVLAALNIVRDFLLAEKQITFFLVDLRDKEEHADEYALIQRLMDLRMIHLIHSSLSDAHEAGRRSEVYLLDLSQYTGARLKQKLWVLDLHAGHLLMRRTRSDEPNQVGTTPRQLIALLRRGPGFGLAKLTASNARPDAG